VSWTPGFPIVAVKADAGDMRWSPDESELDAGLSALRTVLQEDGWSPMEIGLALFVQRTGWELRKNVGTGKPRDSTEVRDIVEACYERTRETIPGFRLKSRRSL